MDTQKSGRSRIAKARKVLNPTEMFFYEHAGFSYDPKTQTPDQGHRESAIRYAEAENIAMRHQAIDGWHYEWDIDREGCTGCDCGNPDCDCSSGRPHKVMYCILRDGKGETLASLFGICKPSKEYQRVIAAELALEAS